MANVYEAFSFNDATVTGKLLSDMTVDYCKDVTGAAVSQTGMTLVELGVGDFVLMNPNITVRTFCRLHLTADSTKRAVVCFDPVDGNISTLGGTAQSGDAFARLGAPVGVSIAADIAEIEAETDLIAAAPTVVQIRQEMDANSTKLTFLTGTVALDSTVAKDATVMKTASYAAPDNTNITNIINAINDGTHGLAALLTAIGTRMATFAYTTPDNADIVAIKADVESVTYGLNAIITAIAAITPPDNTDILAIKADLETASTGLIAVAAAIKAKTDTITAMTGAYPVLLTVYQTATVTPIPDVSITIKNSDKTVTLGVVSTDVNGTTLNADGSNKIMLASVVAGYKLLLVKSGVVFAETTLTQADVVAGTKTIYGTAATMPALPPANMQNLFGNVRRLNWAVATGDVVTAAIASNEQVISNALIQSCVLSSALDTSGKFLLVVPCGADIVVTVPANGSYKFTVSNVNDTVDISTYL